MFRITLRCSGIPEGIGVQAAADITEEFSHRPWQHNVTCKWEGPSLLLEAESENDADGLALLDEFSDAISACVEPGCEGSIRVVEVTELEV